MDNWFLFLPGYCLTDFHCEAKQTVARARFPSAKAPLLMRGIALRRRLPNKFPNPWPRCTLTPTKNDMLRLAACNSPRTRCCRPSLFKTTSTWSFWNAASGYLPAFEWNRSTGVVSCINLDVPNSLHSTGTYCFFWKVFDTVSPCLPLSGTMRSNGTRLSPTTRGLTTFV